MRSYIVKVLSTEHLTHDVLRIVTEKPAGYSFTPGQAAEVSIKKEYWNAEKRPFTFTSLPADDHLEFIIKTYPGHKGVTNQLLKLRLSDELILSEPWGAISFQGEGVFIAGGAGITPFISIFRQLVKQNKLNGNQLLFANKSKEDIILENELKGMLGDRMTNILSGEVREGYLTGFITRSVLDRYIQDTDRKFYVCGPPPMMDLVLRELSDLGVADKTIVTEI